MHALFSLIARRAQLLAKPLDAAPCHPNYFLGWPLKEWPDDLHHYSLRVVTEETLTDTTIGNGLRHEFVTERFHSTHAIYYNHQLCSLNVISWEGEGRVVIDHREFKDGLFFRLAAWARHYHGLRTQVELIARGEKPLVLRVGGVGFDPEVMKHPDMVELRRDLRQLGWEIVFREGKGYYLQQALPVLTNVVEVGKL
jgi:hypothetical protein